MTSIKDSDVLISQENEILGLPRREGLGDEEKTLPRTGIALSGGGIRSAIVSIGALQALAALDLLKHFEIMSGVSGGGYAASALHWWWSERRRNEQAGGPQSQDDIFGTGPTNFPYGTRHPNPQKAGVGQETTLQEKILEFIRWHGSYLTPGDGITAASGIAVVLRTLFLNLVVWVPLLVFAFILINWTGYLTCPFVSGLLPPLGGVIPLMHCVKPALPPNDSLQLIQKLLNTAQAVLPNDISQSHYPMGRDTNFFHLGLPFDYAIYLSYLIIALFILFAIAMALLSHRSYDAQVRPSFRAWVAKLVAALLFSLLFGFLMLFGWNRGVFQFSSKLSAQSSTLLTLFALFFASTAYLIWTITDAVAYFGGLRRLAVNAAYVFRRWFEIWAGRMTIPTISIFAFGTVPILPYYLLSLGTTKAQSAILGFVTAISGAGSSIYGHYAVVQNIIPGIMGRIISSLAAGIFIYLLFVLAYFISVIFLVNLSNSFVLVIVVGFVALSIAMCTFVNINNISLHRFYRDRLMEAFMPDKDAVMSEHVNYARGADRVVLSDLAVKANGSARLPYLILSANVILVNDTTRKFSSRGGDNFMLSSIFVGSGATGWRRTDEYERIHGPLTLASAAATSGAAVNARAAYVGKGFTRSNLISVVMTLLNTRLGMWVANPARSRKKVPGYLNPVLFYGLFGRIIGRGYRANSSFMELSDGGHFENLGLYELARRKTEIILVIDAEQDENLSFPAFVAAIVRIRTDFKAVIEFEEDKGPEYLSPDQKLKFPHDAPSAKQPYFACRIRYDNGPAGVIIYLKTALIKELSMATLAYRTENVDFPNQSTLNQFFAPPQFEAYRELGFQSVMIAARDLNLAVTINDPWVLWQTFISRDMVT
jgi:hypothetical protein